MGNVKSFCCKDNVSEIDDREERSRILNNASCDDLYNNSTTSAPSQQDSISYGSMNNGNGSKTLEQSALDKIFQKMVSNVIDVAPGETIMIQQAEILERQKTYQSKLNCIKTPLPLKRHLSPDNATHSTNSNPPQGQEKPRTEYEPISIDDIQLINEISTKSVKAIRGLQINSSEQVVAQFRP